ncbi:unnamed protein product [Merluccius merluccius]
MGWSGGLGERVEPGRSAQSVRHVDEEEEIVNFPDSHISAWDWSTLKAVRESIIRRCLGPGRGTGCQCSGRAWQLSEQVVQEWLWSWGLDKAGPGSGSGATFRNQSLLRGNDSRLDCDLTVTDYPNEIV